ncbi:MAG TPA: heparan-alpha-glucosaminide N-acetyltransferase domain-containing protein [Candidatus Sulfopaludibacter sp.]|nr:heparan-alpha-glucosaminide N-acetyltransferase domain-containing protein [Candidatus Sulfopaludibacter sp.]
MPARNETAPSSSVSLPQRLKSLDALRGFDMFWIIGADSLVYALRDMSPNPVTGFLATQLDHADWAGFHFYDLIFPLFVFIAGVSLTFSLGKTIARAGRGEAVKRVLRRSVLLFALGIFYNGGLTHPWPDIRLMGVLERIALAYFFAGLCFCFCRPRALVAICVALLAGYWALMTFVPFPDVRPTPGVGIIAKENGFIRISQVNLNSTNCLRGVFIKGVNLSNYLDQRYLPGRKYDGTWDPEGILSTLPAIATCLLGVLAGWLLKSQNVTNRRKVALLLALGAAAVLAGWLWGIQFPVIKKIWTSSYVLVAGGYSAILLGAFYQIVDVWQWQTWCRPFVWLGMNSITLYLTAGVLDGFGQIATRLVGGDVKNLFDVYVATGSGELAISLVGLLLVFWLARFLYQRKIFLRL